jgi:hypothetical protein
MTDCRLAAEIAAAMLSAIEGGKASMAVIVEQNFRNSRRLTPWRAKPTPTVPESEFPVSRGYLSFMATSASY